MYFESETCIYSLKSQYVQFYTFPFFYPNMIMFVIFIKMSEKYTYFLFHPIFRPEILTCFKKTSFKKRNFLLQVTKLFKHNYVSK